MSNFSSDFFILYIFGKTSAHILCLLSWIFAISFSLTNRAAKQQICMLQFYLFSPILEYMSNFFVLWNKLFTILKEYFLFLNFLCYAQHNQQIHNPHLRLIYIINIFSICFLGPDIAHRNRTTNLLSVSTLKS